MLNRYALLFFSLLAGTLSVPTGSGAALGKAQETRSAELGLSQLLRTYFKHLSTKRFDRAEKVIATIRKSESTEATGNGLAALLESPILAARKKDAEARRLLTEGQAAFPNEPQILVVILKAYLVVGRPDFAGGTLDIMIAHAPP